MLSEPNAKPRHSAYREYAPAAVLREHVLCFWTQSVDAAGGEYSHRVLPDACIDIVFFNDRAPVIVGPWTEAFVSRLAGGANLTGVRLHPGRAAEVLGLPASELLNASAPMRDVWRKTLCANFDGVSAGDTPTVQLARLEAAMLRRACDVRTQDRAMRFAVGWLADNPDVRVETLSRELRLSERQLRRRFSAAVGYGPKTFQSVLRFQRLLHLASRVHGATNLAHLAAAAGYSDQPHMNREVRRLSGTTPTDLLQSSACTLTHGDLIASNQRDTR
jgi:AraC-like DNA-binding protein